MISKDTGIRCITLISSSIDSMLIPIRVRGKNKRDQSRNLRGSVLEQGAATRPRGRPLKLGASSTSDSTTSSHPRRSSKTSRPSKSRRKQMKEGRLPEAEFKMPLSRLESLPVELLQSIFLYSPNIHLPLASPYLARALSSEHLYSRLILLAFSAIIRTHEELVLHPDLTSASLQTAIMSRRWFNSDLMRRCQVIFAKEILETEQSNSTWEVISDKTTEVSNINSVHQTSRRTFQLRRDHLSKQIDVFQGDFGTSVHIVGVASPKFYRFPLCQTAAWVAQSEHVLIPETSLHGPWTKEKLDLLEMLCSAGATVDWINTSAGEIAEQGLKDAIMEGSMRAVKLLTKEPTCISREIERKNIGVKIDTRHVRLAVLEAGCDVDIVQALVQHPKSTIDLDDREIVAWAIRDQWKGSMKGGWLLNKIHN